MATTSGVRPTYQALGRKEQALCLRRDVYSGTLRLEGEDDEYTLIAANNYALSLIGLQRFEEVKSLLRRTLPVAQRVLGENTETTLRMRWYYADALYEDDGATLEDLREAVNTLEETEQTARRVLGEAHPHTVGLEEELQAARDALYARGLP